jgi:predicted RNase H-related nuclease YkuK (DUF458 family)
VTDNNSWIDAAKKAIAESSPSSSIYIGCDSIRYKKHDRWYAKFSAVIIVHMDSKKGCRLFHNSVDMPDYGNIKQRLLTEVQHAVTTAAEIIDVIGDRHLEIHIDVNPNPKHKSNIAVREALGWVQGSLGIDAKIKPDAWAATHCADHLVRNKHLLN